jgi:hypothetical protein
MINSKIAIVGKTKPALALARLLLNFSEKLGCLEVRDRPFLPIACKNVTGAMSKAVKERRNRTSRFCKSCVIFLAAVLDGFRNDLPRFCPDISFFPLELCY